MLKLAWRNLWRNKRRTLITVASIFFAVFLAVLFRGYHSGMWHELLESVLHSYTGYIQVHAKNYWKEKTLEYTINWNDTLKHQLLSEKEVKNIIPRIESFALASVGDKTKVVLVAGIETESEDQFTKLSKKLVTGSYLENNETSSLVSQRLAKFLGVSVGDTLVLISQGYQGTSATGLFPVKGIVKLPSPEWDNQMVFLPLKAAQEFYSAENKLTSLVVDIKKPQKLDYIASSISKTIDLGKYEVMTWKEMLIELYQQYISDNASGKILIALLYLIIGFGIFGTVMMMVAERTREFGVMIAIGMKRHRLAGVVSAEMFFIAVIGVIAGMIASIPAVAYYHFNPIHFSGEIAKTFEVYGMEPVMQILWQADYIINQGLAVFIITLIAIAYPIYSLNKLSIIKALKS